jgi:MYXO-CTERM domain-containing protein
VLWIVLSALFQQTQGAPGDCGLEPPEVALRAPAVPSKAGERPGAKGPLVRRVRLGPTGHVATGALSGKTVYVSPGHGFTWDAGAWRTQRGNTNDIVEDLVSAETIDQYLLAYLRAMGAHVVPVREADMTAELVIVDDDAAVIEGVTAAAGGAGWGAVTLPITSDEVHPFSSGGTATIATAAAESGRVIWEAEVPAAGPYNVYVAYAQGPDRATDAHYVVRHADGEAHFRVDQTRHGGSWVLLGRFYFEDGAAVLLVNDSAESDRVLSVDAVRFGGGAGLFDRGGGPLARPMFEHCARYYAQWNGAPTAVYTYVGNDRDDDVGTRSRFAAWDHEAGEDAVYVAWHTNAPNPGTGTSTYTYSPNPPPASVSEFTGTPGSLELQDAIHAELMSDLRAAWDPGWEDRGRHTAYFGEVNPNHNDEMPAVLVEVAFHDTPSDAAALKETAFRRVAARAFAQGIARYFAERDGTSLVLPPEPPTALRVENDGGGGLRVSWRPPVVDPAGGDPATSYRVYLSRTGYGFDEGLDVDGESTVIPLGAGETRFVRVAALNEGGESLPTEVVGARVAPSGHTKVLVVGGFDRSDAALLPREELPFLGVVDRMVLDRVNDGTYAVRHGLALADAGFSFDGASDEAVEAGDLDLAVYDVVDWFLGEESSEPLSAAQREAIGRLLTGGGALFVSGSEIGWALGSRGSAEEQAFFRDVFHAGFAVDDAQTYAVRAVDGPYDGLSFTFDDPLRGSYDADFPDTFTAGEGAAAALEYDGGIGGIAAVTWSSGAGDRGVLFGFPFETIVGRETRRDVMARTLAWFEIAEDPAGDAGCGCRTPAGRDGPTGAGALLVLLFLLRRTQKGPR